MRPLSVVEQENTIVLSGKGIDFSFLLPTKTGLEKSIIDAIVLFKSVEYTRSPRTYQFLDLLAAGFVTVDHLIKEKRRGAHEREPLFKINKAGYSILFPVPIKFELGS